LSEEIFFGRYDTGVVVGDIFKFNMRVQHRRGDPALESITESIRGIIETGVRK